MSSSSLSLHPAQYEVAKYKARFKAVVAGRRFGKSHLCKVQIISKAAKIANGRIWYIAPSFRMAKQIMWKDLVNSVPRSWLAKKPNETELTMYLKNGTEISCKGADSPDSLRGVGLNYVVLDEYQDMRPEVWEECIRPTLASTGGEALFIGTPKSFNLLYDVYVLGQDKTKKQWMSWNFPTISSPFIPKHEIEQAKQDMDPRTFRQEFCHLPSTQVRIASGDIVAISDVSIGQKLLYRADSGLLLPCDVVDKRSTGTKMIVDVCLENGERFAASDGHKMKVNGKKIELEKAASLELVYTPRRPKTSEERLAALTGFNTGDGNIQTKTERYKRQDGSVSEYERVSGAFYSSVKIDLNDIANDLYEEGMTTKLLEPKIKKGKTECYQIQIGDSAAKRLIDLGAPVNRKPSQAFTVPDWIVNGTDSVKAAYLSALWGAEGSTPNAQTGGMKVPKMPVLQMVKVDEWRNESTFFEQICQMMKDLGVEVTLKHRDSTRFGSEYRTYSIYVNSGYENTIRFFDRIGFTYCREKDFLSMLWKNYLMALQKDASDRVNDVVTRREAGMSFVAIGRELGKSASTCKSIHARSKSGSESRSGWDFPKFNTWVEGRLC